jgi:hypothetical protein
MLLSGADKPCCEIGPISTDTRIGDKDNGGCGTAGYGECRSYPGSCRQSVQEPATQVSDK